MFKQELEAGASLFADIAPFMPFVNAGLNLLGLFLLLTFRDYLADRAEDRRERRARFEDDRYRQKYGLRRDDPIEETPVQEGKDNAI